MIKNLRSRIAKRLSPEYEQELVQREKKIQQEVDQRVAEALSKMDPFEPFLRKYHGIFSEEFVKPEDNLGQISKIKLYAWAYTNRGDPSFIHLTNWIQNVQGNNTLRKAKSDYEWFFGRCAIVMVELYVKEVSRLARLYEEVVLRKEEMFDSNLTAE